MRTTPTMEHAEASSAAGEVSNRTSTQSKDTICHSFPPSHILQDGRSIYLPEFSKQQRSKFLGRSIARHNLLADLSDDKGTLPRDNQEESNIDYTKEASTPEPKIHPLAIASAKLQTDGVAELSKAINLSNLVGTDEYFSFTNIVDPSLETGTSAAASVTEKAVLTRHLQEEQTLRATYIGKRKREQFENAAKALARHGRRLAASIAAQTIIDDRLRQLRPQWRLVAPEHGTRARPHAVHAGEVVAVDVDVYDGDRTGSVGMSTRRAGRIARKVPRYAIVQLQNKYSVKDDVLQWTRQNTLVRTSCAVKSEGSGEDDDKMKIDTEETRKTATKTQAEPYAIADPSLGNVDVDFDPKKVPMLALQFDIDKPFTGFCQSARLTPLTVTSSSTLDDEEVVVSLQHSLFCASLFESIRRELVPDDEGPAGMHATGWSTGQTAWLPSNTDEEFLPVPTLMVSGYCAGTSVGALSVVHCHDGEVKVQLDAEYTLTVKLVEAEPFRNETSSAATESGHAGQGPKNSEHSGSRTPSQLKALCRALLVHAQDVYHAHNLASKRALSTGKETSTVLKREQKELISLPYILEKCVGLGGKLLFEPKVHLVLQRLRAWIECEMNSTDALDIEWLPLSAFDEYSRFTVCCLTLCLDVTIERGSVVVTSFREKSGFRQVQFHSEKELELFLKLQIRRVLAEKFSEDEDGANTPTASHVRSGS